MSKKIESIPKHVAIIMDGNRRWAKSKGLPVLEGHRVAAEETIEALVEKAVEMGISYLTLWALSTENWERSKEEIFGLMTIARALLSRNIERLNRKGVRVLAIGDLGKFPKDIQKGIRNGIEKTKNNKKITVILALNYGGRDEIVRAINKWHSSAKCKPSSRAQVEGVQSAKLKEEEFGNFLDTRGVPDPDLIIRTGGEMRLSGFLLWQSEYSELYFTDVLFPDFKPEEFKKAISEYQQRQRRLGR